MNSIYVSFPVRRGLIGGALFLTILSPIVAQDRTLTVRGTGEVVVVPDQATVRLGMTRQADTAGRAQDDVNRAAQGILEAIRALRIPDEAVRTVDLSLHPVYAPGRPGEDEPRVVGYRATNVVSVRVDDVEQVGSVIDAGLRAGANRLDGIQFGLRRDEEARAEALRRAATAARAKAEELARSLGLRLVEIAEVVEEGATIPPRDVFVHRAATLEMATPVSPGSLTVTAGVSLRYTIADP
jgi:uncharacterized protein